MKGLFAKDYALFLQRKRFFVGAFAAAILMAYFSDSNTFVLTWVAVIVGIFSISTISYDEYDNSMPFLMTMPVSGKAYALEKHLLVVIFGVLAAIASELVLIMISLIKNTTLNIGEIFAESILNASIIMFFIALAIPPMLKWGAEQGRLVIMIVAFPATVVAIMISATSLDSGLALMAFISNLGIYKISAVSLGLAAVGTVAASLVSIRIMEKKEY